jgi:hypothetical protein
MLRLQNKHVRRSWSFNYADEALIFYIFLAAIIKLKIDPSLISKNMCPPQLPSVPAFERDVGGRKRQIGSESIFLLGPQEVEMAREKARNKRASIHAQFTVTNDARPILMSTPPGLCLDSIFVAEESAEVTFHIYKPAPITTHIKRVNEIK